MVKYSDVYESELEKDKVFKKSKIYLCLLCLLTIALLMSFVSQNFYWAFALFIGLPIYFLGMNLLFRYQANSMNANQNGCICMGCSFLWIIGLIGLFTYLYMTSYATYFSQKYTGTWCRAYSIEKVDTSTQQYYSITYEVIDDVAEYKKSRGLTNNYQQNTTPKPLPNQIYGCGCTSNKKREMNAKSLHGYDYSFKSDGTLELLPFWICDNVNDSYVPTLSEYSDIYRCYMHTYNSPSQTQLMDPDICSTSNSFIQVTFDNPPYYSYQQFLYMIGFIFLSIFGVACNFPMTYLVLRFQYRNVAVKDLKQPTDRRKVLICCALKKALMIDRINKQKLQLGIQNQFFPALTAMTRQATSKGNLKLQKEQKPQLSIQNYIQDLKIPENQSITYFRKEIIEELIEFLYTDNVHYHIVKRRQMSMQRNRGISHFTQNNNNNNQSQIDQINLNFSHNYQQQQNHHQQNPSQDVNSIAININQLLNIEPNNVQNQPLNSQLYQNSNNQAPQGQEGLQIQGQLQQFSINNPHQTGENQRLQQNEDNGIDRNNQGNYQYQVNRNDNNINSQMQIQDVELNQEALKQNQMPVIRSEQASVNEFNKFDQHQRELLQQLHLKKNKSGKQGISNDEEDFKSEDYRNDDDVEDEEIQWHNFELNSGYNDLNNSIHPQSIQQYSGNNLKIRNRQSSQLPPFLSNFSNPLQQQQPYQQEDQIEIENKLSTNQHQTDNLTQNLQQQRIDPNFDIQQNEQKDKENSSGPGLQNNQEQLATHPCETSLNLCKYNLKDIDSPSQFIQNNTNNIKMDEIQEDAGQQQIEEEIKRDNLQK